MGEQFWKNWFGSESHNNQSQGAFNKQIKIEKEKAPTLTVYFTANDQTQYKASTKLYQHYMTIGPYFSTCQVQLKKYVFTQDEFDKMLDQIKQTIKTEIIKVGREKGIFFESIFYIFRKRQNTGFQDYNEVFCETDSGKPIKIVGKESERYAAIMMEVFNRNDGGIAEYFPRHLDPKKKGKEHDHLYLHYPLARTPSKAWEARLDKLSCQQMIDFLPLKINLLKRDFWK